MRVTNHKLHAILTLFTLGVWGIVWLIVAVSNIWHNKDFQEKLESDEQEKQLAEKVLAERMAEENRRKSLQKEIDQKNLSLARILDNKDPQEFTKVEVSEITRIEEKISELNEAVEKKTETKANPKAGYVYVISNVGSFGPNIVKIGASRGTDPTERIKDLGGAGVPFKFDTHMVHYSEDAFAVEAILHRAFADRKVNRANSKREFFYATPEEVKEEVLKLDGLVISFELEFTDTEYQKSEEIRRNEESSASERKRGRRAAY
jgi:hypothetical protein